VYGFVSANTPDPRSAGPSRRDLLRWAGLGGLAGLAAGVLSEVLPAEAKEVGVEGGTVPAAAGSSTFDPLRPPPYRWLCGRRT
jgi:hypothetical protein